MTAPRIELVTNLQNKKVNFPIDEKARKSLKQQTVEGNDPFKYAPIQYKVKYANKTIYLSRVFSYGSHAVLFAYVDGGTDKLEPRLFYLSNSHAVWRVAPAYNKKFAKGFEEFSCDLPPLLNIALYSYFQNEIYQAQKSESDSFPNMEAFINSFTESFEGSIEAPLSFMNECGEKQKPTINCEQQSTHRGYLYYSEDNKASKYKTDEKQLPDFSSIEVIAVPNRFYEEISKGAFKELRLATCLSKDKRTRFLFAELGDKNKPLRFLVTASQEPPNLSSYCTDKVRYDLGYINMPPFIRPGTFPTNMAQNPENASNASRVKHKEKEVYVDLSKTNYMGFQPINQLLQNQALTQAMKGLDEKEDQFYLSLIRSIHHYIYKHTWEIEGLYDKSTSVCLAKEYDEGKLPDPVRKQFNAISEYLKLSETISDYKAMPTPENPKIFFEDLKTMAVNSLQLAENSKTQSPYINLRKYLEIFTKPNDELISESLVINKDNKEDKYNI